jgi:deoxyadenosine/deoxycytidine kinase
MIDTRLIVIDGLPGSGKTTTAEWLTTQIQQQNMKIWYLPEYDTAHPLWWYEYWDGNDYLTPDFDNISIENFLHTSLSKWRGFVDSADQLVLAESVFFQDAAAMFLMGGATPTRLMEYALDIQRIAQSLDPVLIYFRQNDVSNALQRICTIRGKEFEDELVTNMERFPYLKQRSLKGLDGVVALWQNIQKLTDAIFDEYKIRKLAIDVSDGNWLDYRQRIMRFLEL